MKLDSMAALLALFMFGTILGLGAYTFIYAQGASYLSNDPKVCMNCHVMRDHFRAWTQSSHHATAVCNDCHTPSGLVDKYYTKALNGWNHSVAFTTGDFKDPIQITARNREITERSCRKCHANTVHQIDTHQFGKPISCVRCHSNVGHLE